MRTNQPSLQLPGLYLMASSPGICDECREGLCMLPLHAGSDFVSCKAQAIRLHVLNFDGLNKQRRCNALLFCLQS